jgi:hypothetical protein
LLVIINFSSTFNSYLQDFRWRAVPEQTLDAKVDHNVQEELLILTSALHRRPRVCQRCSLLLPLQEL